MDRAFIFINYIRFYLHPCQTVFNMQQQYFAISTAFGKNKSINKTTADIIIS